MPLPVGSRAPDFELPSQDGKLVRLSRLIQQSVVVLYFYPRDETGGCTAEACAFRDQYEVFKEAGAEVVGVSKDDVKSHQAFAMHHRLGFVILADTDNAVRTLYEVKDTIPFLLPGRDTYVIDKSRVIVHHFSSQTAPKLHVREALRIVKQVAAKA